MEFIKEIIIPTLCLAVIGGILGLALAFAGAKFAVKVDKRIKKITKILPGANCGGCGYTGCQACAEAIVKGEAKVNACTVAGDAMVAEIAEIMGVAPEKAIRIRAQVMCSGTHLNNAKKKYHYEGVKDCSAAVRMGGGDKVCPNGCVGLGSCVKSCVFDAIKILNGIAAVDYDKCRGCGACVAACPKHIIRLIPYDSAHWVGCCSVDKGTVTRQFCDVGCIGCHKCEKVCESGAITVDGFIASIDYSKCVDCGKCVDICPRHIIWSRDQQDKIGLTVEPEDFIDNTKLNK